MSFDKIKAMRTAERCLAQGKIRAAINEYKRVVENDPKDFGTLNILGDLYIKNAEEQEAVGCFTQVADYYNTQGFSQKAIAVYSKISRLKPDSIEVSTKLAQLYKSKGSFSEARTHFIWLAEQYQRRGQKIEALAIWKQIADLDPNDSATYLKIAEVYWQEEEKDEAAKAFAQAGKRLLAQGQFEPALAAFSRALEIDKDDLTILNGYVTTQIKLNCADEAVKLLNNILEEQPYNRGVIFLLIDCHIDSDNPAEAEKAVIKLVEQEPTNYPKFLELVEIYLKNKDLDSASRILSMSSEHLLVGGQSDEFLHFTKEILARNPEHLEALRLSVRYYGWHRDESEFKNSLERLAEVGQLNNSVDDERYALSQLVMIMPHEVGYAQRLQEINTQYKFEDAEYEPNDINVNSFADIPSFENFALVNDDASDEKGFDFNTEFSDEGENFESFTDVGYSELNQNHSTNGTTGDISTVEISGENIVENVAEEVSSNSDENVSNYQVIAELKPADELKLASELESIDFYIAQGYYELAVKSLNALVEQFGNRAELSELRTKLENPSAEFSTNGKPPAKKVEEPLETKATDGFDDFRSELGLEEKVPKPEGDYETHYQMATAYHEMGLMEEAIREFQDAINLAKPSDGTRRFFHCANLLGVCFMEKAMPNVALMWFQRGLENVGLSIEEKQALYYEIGNAYEIGGESEKAGEYFEKIYVDNIDYRDVGKRLKNLKSN
ncbi:hypothetical protein BH10ACI1_BH10ACI1_08710 [soil metagenome]